MTVLEIAIERLKALPEDKQAYAAEVIEHIASSNASVYHIPEEHLAAVREGLEQAQRGEFASEEEIDRVLHQPWV